MAASGSMFGSGSNSMQPPGAQGGAAGGNDLFGSLFSTLHGFFNNNEDPYGSAFETSRPFYNNAISEQDPFRQQGARSQTGFNDWLGTMKDPQEFINHIMGGYKESPWAQNLQRSSMRAGTNAASAAGLTGSTPFAQQLQQNANNISSADMNNWLQNILGVNTQYGSGLNNNIERGQHATDVRSQLFSNQGNNAGAAAYGTANYNNQRENSNWNNVGNLLGNVGSVAAMFL